VFTARSALSPHIKQIRFVLKGLKDLSDGKGICDLVLGKLEACIGQGHLIQWSGN
jgi:hypothetical protein